MKYGNFSPNPEYIKSMTKHEFVKKFTGKVHCKTHTLEQIYDDVVGKASTESFDPRDKIKIDGPDKVKNKREKVKKEKEPVKPEPPIIQNEVTELNENSDEIPSE
jgi:hypothetical protein